MKEGSLKELLAATASATELEQTPKEKPEEENSGSNSHSRKGGFEQLLWWQQILKVKKKKKKRQPDISPPWPPSTAQTSLPLPSTPVGC